MDVSVVVNAHREGLLAQPALLSVAAAVAEARKGGVTVEAIAVLDRPDRLTEELFRASPAIPLRVMIVDNGDLGASRNDGVAAASGRWLAFLDADDLFGDTWIASAHAAANADPRPIVWHPEVNLYFGEQPHVFRHVDMEDEYFDPLSLMVSNHWTALAFAERATFVEFPYRRTDLERQIGYEDWSWNIETVASGILHKIVPGTGHAIRLKADSLRRRTNDAGAVPGSSGLFRNMIGPK